MLQKNCCSKQIQEGTQLSNAASDARDKASRVELSKAACEESVTKLARRARPDTGKRARRCRSLARRKVARHAGVGGAQQSEPELH